MSRSTDPVLAFLQGGGELGALIREKDWSATPLGPPDQWPQSLRTTLGILLNSRYPMFVFWGPELIKIYNDAYRPITGRKHPWALGRSAPEVWPEIWDDIKPLVDRALAGDPTWSDDLMLVMERSGFPEEVYFTFSYSPVADESGGVGGMFCACTETTGKVLGERRLRALRDLAAAPAEARSVDAACVLSAEVLDRHAADVPFSLIYLADETGATRLVASSGVTPGDAAAPPILPADVADAAWPAVAVARAREPQVVTPLAGRFARVPAGPWQEPPSAAMVLPLVDRALERSVGVIVLGISSRRPFDDEYRGWFELVAGQVSGSMSNARAAEEERKRADALAELDRAKTAFFSNVSHEFRTPLTLMLGPLDDLLDAPRGELPAPARDALAVMRRNGQRLLKLVNTLLDFSRIEAGRVQARYEPIDLAGLTRDLASVFRSAMERAGLQYEVACETLPEPVYVDRDMWEKVVMNLLSNAFKYTLEGRVRLSLAAADGHAVLTVADSGIGIADDELPRLFNRFHRIEGAKGRTHEGTGIGLALVHELVKLHGGVVEVESAPARGSVFTVRLPFGRDHLPADRIGAAPSRTAMALGPSAFVEEALRWLPADQATGGATGPGARLDRPEETAGVWRGTTGRPTVLVADDNADMRDYVSGLLADVCDVTAVADGAQALAVVAQARPDLVLSDVMMPNLDGFGLLRALRGSELTASIPVILLSARAGEDARVDGLQAGADDYLIKPFSARELIARVSGALALASARQEAADALLESERRFRYMADSAPVMIWVTEPDGFCTFLSRSWYEFTGQTPETGLGFGWLEATHPSDRTAAQEAFLAANARREAFRLEYRLRRHDGVYRWAIDAAAPRFASDGGFLGYIGTVIDITERKDAETRREAILDAERHARREAERVNRMKDEFLATLSHELRTPLNAILGWSQVLERGAVPADELRKGLEAISRNARAQTQMIEDLLDMSRIVSGKIRLELARTSLADVIEQAVLSAEPAAAARGVRLESFLPPRVDPIAGDPHRLQQVFWNLLTNAIKFTPAGGTVTVRLTRVGPRLEVTVADTGEGIEPEMIVSLFERFRQADATTTRTRGGLGLGLSIVKELVELHGGSVRAESPGLGHGSTFTVTLPTVVALPRADAPAAPAPADAAGEGGPETPAPRLDGVRVLVVEDDDDARQLLQHMLAECGAHVTAASRAAEALAHLQRSSFDLLLSDIGMPEQDGYELMQQVRALPSAAARGIPAIALTAYASAGDRQRALDAGFQMHVTKPVDPVTLWTACAKTAKLSR